MEVHPCVQDRPAMDVEEFDATKTGVKGLLDSGITKVPKIFIRPSLETMEKLSCDDSDISLRVPLIDLAEFGSSKKKKIIIDELRDASKNWGVFQLINHGIPISVMDEIIAVGRAFHEQPNEVKKELYSRDNKKSVRFYSNVDLFLRKGGADWMDTMNIEGNVDPAALPQICRDAAIEFMRHIIELKNTLSELLSEALGLRSDSLSSMECLEHPTTFINYFPACPEPNLVLGSRQHTDPDFMTIILQDNVGGLQVRHQNKWVDVSPVNGALIFNMGDMMQLITNDKFKSVEHRVVVSETSPRVTVGCLFYPDSTNVSKPFGPIKELLSDQEPIYRETNVLEFIGAHWSNRGSGKPCLPGFKVDRALASRIE